MTHPTLNPTQISQYLDRIRLTSGRYESVTDLSPKESLDYLSRLMRYHLSAVPFENLTLHYTHHRRVSLDADDLFEKIVGSGTRGGYCMENNTLFGALLRSLGYRLHSAGARVKAGGASFGGWSHMINIVNIDGQRYVVDVGFGANCMIEPMKIDRAGTIVPNLRPASARIIRDYLPEASNKQDEDQKMWIYQHRNNDESDWVDIYCFTELEFLPDDYKIMSLYTSTSPQTFFTQMVVCVLLLRDADKEELKGTMILLGNNLKARIDGNTNTSKAFESEDDRLECLKDTFGIVFDGSGKKAIKGTAAEVKTQAFSM
ncbi:arylamine N-acetyltransferase 1 [Aulographum hederae CBS 113979]|uniref:Arylamine N-acetyltransferase 1 n=1 Tax=Aulographum hederae CBS 113979 TaxID=1176131 RepID=A0A6G1GTP6_9PEZI|nr:arylamine N-acetyltransferase 1 [Aulographum hederae CBS 113979]